MKTNKEYEELTPEEAEVVIVTVFGCIIAVIAFLVIVGLISLLLLTRG